MIQSTQENEALLTAAAPLNLKNVYGDLSQSGDPGGASGAQAGSAPTDANKKNYVGMVLHDSEQKCAYFVGSLSAGQRISNTTFDILTTTLNALATVLTPISTVHALTAGATVSSGTRLAINQDVYEKETAQLITGAIDATYYKEYAQYAASLETMDPVSMSPSVEVARIEGFHKDCSLDRALTYVFANQPHLAQKPAPTDDQMQKGTPFTGANGTVYVITKAPTPADQTVKYQILMSTGTLSPEFQVTDNQFRQILGQ
ncbi:hypothetical protein [Paraburkholderia acidiphila]|uniref:Uncharacterized protein n=1 Tax=Paraburkholderia acidiphila TaxID=2571747 RepID=A0A7Z2GAK4_9BURK|nr:hypothetical protein [Paraburkholderia acidiphila]QGZ58142.1 hypothetical protein FAZ97_24360 [Paraburkholderia acidiphila]